MAVRATTLFGLTVFKSWLPVTVSTRDAELTLIADWATEFIERFTRRVFVTRTITAELYDGTGTHRLRLRSIPVSEIGRAHV